jgi:uncharacterized protein (DUF58 family)
MKKHRKNLWQFIRVLGLLAILFSYAMFQGGFVSWFLFYSFLPFGLYAFVLIFYPLHSIKVKRTFNQKVYYYAGEKLRVTVQIDLPRFFSLIYILAEEKLPPSLAKMTPFRTVLMPLGRRMCTYVYEMDELPRGEHIFSAIHFKITDLLGMVAKEAIVSTEDSILVYPRYVEMNARKMGQQLDDGSVVSPLPLHRDTAMAIGAREYTQGDRFSWIHWKASARKNELMTKDFEERQSEDLMVFLDRTPTALFEEVVTFTASFVRMTVKAGVKTGLVSVGRDRIVIQAQNGETHLQRLFYHLAKVACDSQESFARIMYRETMQWPLSFSFCCITSQLYKETASIMADLASKNRRGTVVLIKKAEGQLSKEEREWIEVLRKKGVTVKVTMPQHFANAFVEGGK